jgi:hypothetical protein
MFEYFQYQFLKIKFAKQIVQESNASKKPTSILFLELLVSGQLNFDTICKAGNWQSAVGNFSFMQDYVILVFLLLSFNKSSPCQLLFANCQL